MKPLRFCHLTTFYPPYSFGGDAIFVQRLCHLLADRGHQVEVVHCRDSYETLKARGEGPDLGPHPGVKVHTLESGWGCLSPLLTHLSGRPWLKSERLKTILNQPFDVLHFHNISLLGGPALLNLGRGLKLYTSHEYWLHCPTHLLLKWGKENCQSKSCLACCLYQKRPPQLWRWGSLMEQGLSNVDLFLCPNSYAQQLHHQAGFPGRTEVLPNFVPDIEPRPARRQGFLFVGRLDPCKGIEELCSLFAALPQLQLTVVGDGPLAGKLAGFTRELPNVTLLGPQPPERLPQLYAETEALLIPSKAHELGPLVMMEAMACQTPLVVSPMGGMPDAVKRSGCGLIATSPEEWRDSVLWMSEHPEQAREMGQRGREHYLAHFTSQVHLERYLGLVGDVLSSESRNRQPLVR